MIVKMKFLSISGPRTDIDRVSASYLSKYEMQLENAITELKTTDNLMPFMDVNPYKEPLSKAEQYVAMLAQPKGEMDTSLTADEILTMIRDLNHDYLDLKVREDRLKKQKEEFLERLHELEPFQPLELNLKEVYGYQYMKVRFGRVNVEYYQKLEKYLFDDLNAIFWRESGMKIMCTDAILQHIKKWEKSIQRLNLCILKRYHSQMITRECQQKSAGI